MNGAAAGKADDSSEPVMDMELFDPTTELWKTVARLNRPRLYHSEACLLHDGRVVIAGNTKSFNPANPVEEDTIEVYSPPYLFAGSRPSLQEVTTTVRYGNTLSLKTPDEPNVERASLIKLSSATHSFNADQRYIHLPIVSRGAEELTVRAPRDATVAPAGMYMVVVLNKEGVPSVGKTVVVG